MPYLSTTSRFFQSICDPTLFFTHLKIASLLYLSLSIFPIYNHPYTLSKLLKPLLYTRQYRSIQKPILCTLSSNSTQTHSILLPPPLPPPLQTPPIQLHTSQQIFLRVLTQTSEKSIVSFFSSFSFFSPFREREIRASIHPARHMMS